MNQTASRHSVRTYTTRCVALGMTGAIAFLFFNPAAYADKQWYYYVNGYAGTKKAGPFNSQTDCENAADKLRAQNYTIAPCVSEGSDSSTTDSTASTPASVPSTPAEAFANGVQAGMAAAGAALEKQKADAQNAYHASAQAGTAFYQSERQRQDNLLKQEDHAESDPATSNKQQENADVARARNELLSEIKDDACEVQPGGQTDFFGIPAASPAEIKATIDTKCPQHLKRDVNTAWKQIHCAAEIAQHALDKLRKMESSSAARQRDLDDISFLAKESMSALHGETGGGMTCSPAPPVKFPKPPDMAAISSQYSHMLSRTVDDAQKIYDLQQQALAAQQKIDAAKAKINNPSSASSATSSASSDDPVAKAYAEQQAWQKADQDKINQIYAQQQQMQQSNSDALAALRAAQLELNKLNSQKVQPQQEIDDFESQNKAVLAGQLPDSN
jgi:hypothetical protein